jgi:hypothetical protein
MDAVPRHERFKVSPLRIVVGSGPERAAKKFLCRLGILSAWQTKENCLLSSL